VVAAGTLDFTVYGNSVVIETIIDVRGLSVASSSRRRIMPIPSATPRALIAMPTEDTWRLKIPNLVSAASRDRPSGWIYLARPSRARIRDLLSGSVKEIKDNNPGNSGLARSGYFVFVRRAFVERADAFSKGRGIRNALRQDFEIVEAQIGADLRRRWQFITNTMLSYNGLQREMDETM